MMKRSIRFLLSIALVLSIAISTATVFTGCNDKKDPEPKITDGIYEWVLGDGMTVFYRFRADGTYYAKDWLENDAGTYTVTDEEFAYTNTNISDDNNISGTTPKKVVTTSYSRGVKEFGLGSDGLYGADAPFAQITNRKYTHKPDFEYSDAKEQPSPIYTYYFNNEDGATLVLYHNKTFTDFTGTSAVEGTWTLETDGTFKLTAGSVNNILTVNGKSASYKKGTETLELWNYISLGAVKGTFTATEKVSILGMFEADFRVELYDDYSCKAIINNKSIPVADANGDVVVDEGTWKLIFVGQMPAVVFTFKNAGEATSVMMADSTGIQIAFKAKIFVVAADVAFDSILTFPMSGLAGLNF